VKFRIRPIIGDRPDRFPGDKIIMVAPRPLYGQNIEPIESGWGWAGQVMVDPSEATAITHNHAMDAEVVQWFKRGDVYHWARQDIVDQYGKDLLCEVAEEDLIQHWRVNYFNDGPNEVEL
jgi:hypothetical protein